MSNSEKYNFSDFTYKHYQQILRLAKKEYMFSHFDNYSSCERFILWRHDIDFSPTKALKLSQIEAEENVSGTYFVLLHSSFYNLMDLDVIKQIKEIINNGHQLGLHFDFRPYNISSERMLEYYLEFEKDILETIFNRQVNAFSFHMTNDFTNSCGKKHYAGMINVYSDGIKKNIEYCSDSNGYWRFQRLEDVLTKKRPNQLHVLTHPIWWSEKIESIIERFKDCISQQSKRNMEWYREVIAKYGRGFVDWEIE
jgi:hypothetical protein